jgi:hypothetical protein
MSRGASYLLTGRQVILKNIKGQVYGELHYNLVRKIRKINSEFFAQKYVGKQKKHQEILRRIESYRLNCGGKVTQNAITRAMRRLKVKERIFHNSPFFCITEKMLVC